MELYLLGRKLMKLGEEALPPASTASSIRDIMKILLIRAWTSLSS